MVFMACLARVVHVACMLAWTFACLASCARTCCGVHDFQANPLLLSYSPWTLAIIMFERTNKPSP